MRYKQKKKAYIKYLFLNFKFIKLKTPQKRAALKDRLFCMRKMVQPSSHEGFAIHMRFVAGFLETCIFYSRVILLCRSSGSYLPPPRKTNSN